MFAFCHLLLKLFNNVGQKKLTETSVKKQSHDARDILRVSQSVSCKIINLHHPSVKTHFIRLLFKPFSYSLNETSTRSNKQCVWNQSEAMKTSGLGLSFFSQRQGKVKASTVEVTTGVSGRSSFLFYFCLMDTMKIEEMCEPRSRPSWPSRQAV